MVFMVDIDDKAGETGPRRPFIENNCGWILQASPIRPRLDEIEKSVLQMTESIPPTRRPVGG